MKLIEFSLKCMCAQPYNNLNKFKSMAPEQGKGVEVGTP